MFFALGNDADKVTDHQQLADAGDVSDRGFVHRLQRVADEVAMIGAGVRRPHHTAVQHAGHAHVVHKHQLAGGLGRYVHTGRTGADHAVIGRRLERRAKGQRQLDVLSCQQFAIGDRRTVCRCTGHADDAVADLQSPRIGVELLRCACQQPGPCLGCCGPQRLRMNLNGGTGDGAALVGGACGVAQHHVDTVQADVEFFGHDLSQCGAQTGAQIHMAVQRGDAAVIPERQQNLQSFGRVAAHKRRLTLDGWRRCRRLARDQQHAGGGMKVSAFEWREGTAHTDVMAWRQRWRQCVLAPSAGRRA